MVGVAVGGGRGGGGLALCRDGGGRGGDETEQA